MSKLGKLVGHQISLNSRSVHYYSRSKLFIPNANQNKQHSQSDQDHHDHHQHTKSVSQIIMESNGFISDSGKTGLITYMPLGKRVLNNLTRLIREEMNKIDCQEIEMPSLSDLNLWTQTGRAELLGAELFRLTDRKEKHLCLCPTHEEIVTSLVSKLARIIPPTALCDENPLKLYQITRKYRDESRPKHGLLRTREFLMKDLYTFHLNENCVNQTYEQVCKSYENTFDRLDLNYHKASASVGSMGGKRSDEYHIESEVGEDKIFTCPSCKKSISSDLIDINDEKKSISQEHICKSINCIQKASSSTQIEPKKCIEIGHAFILGDRYTKFFPIEAASKTKSSKTTVNMACFGIGVSRLLQACIEQHHMEKRFPNWPLEIAPFKVAIVPAKEGSREEEKSRNLVKYFTEMLNKVYTDDILVDDRTKLSIGSRLIEAKLIGVPFVITLGKHIHDEQAEIVINSSKVKEAIKKDVVHCHTREVAVILKQIINDYLYVKKQNKVFDYFDKSK